MNYYNSKYNSLIHRELPPPISPCNILATPASKATTSALLHSAYTRVGRVFALLIAVLPLAFASCEKEVMEELPPMGQMYYESVNLPQATLDSITNFTHKFGVYVGSHPESRQDQYFDPTLQNLRNAAALHGYTIKETTVTTGITVNDEWAGEIFIQY